MARYYLVADRHGWHRADMSFDCLRAAERQDKVEWVSALSQGRHADLVRQWMLRTDTVPLSDEWIPAEWLLRAWSSPAMAAAEGGHVDTRARVFEIEAEPVLLGRSIPVVIPELSLTGVDEFRVVREVPNWWLLGPCGREVFALLTQFQTLAMEPTEERNSVDRPLADLRARSLNVVDANRRVGAYAIVRAVTGDIRVAADAALGFVLKDVWHEAPRLYEPWVQLYGLPDLSVAMTDDDLPYPVTTS